MAALAVSVAAGVVVALLWMVPPPGCGGRLCGGRGDGQIGAEGGASASRRTPRAESFGQMPDPARVSDRAQEPPAVAADGVSNAWTRPDVSAPTGGDPNPAAPGLEPAAGGEGLAVAGLAGSNSVVSAPPVLPQVTPDAPPAAAGREGSSNASAARARFRDRLTEGGAPNAVVSAPSAREVPEHWILEPYPESVTEQLETSPKEETAAVLLEASMQSAPEQVEVGLIVALRSTSEAKPNAIVLGHQVPVGWAIEGTDPEVTSWDASSRTAKWLLMGNQVQDGIVTITLRREAENAVDAQEAVRSWLRYRLPGGSYIDTTPVNRIKVPTP